MQNIFNYQTFCQKNSIHHEFLSFCHNRNIIHIIILYRVRHKTDGGETKTGHVRDVPGWYDMSGWGLAAHAFHRAGSGCGGHLAAEALLEGDEGFGAGHAEVLDALQQGEHVVVVAGKELDEQVVLAGSVVTLNDFGDGFEGADYRVVLAGVAKEDADVCAGVVAHGVGRDETFRAYDGAIGQEALDALVYGGAGYATFAGNFKVGSASVLAQHR